MICRRWRGLVKPDCPAPYLEHLRSKTFPQLGRLPGYRGASVLRRTLTSGVEFIVETRWDSLEAIVAFAGPDAEVAVVPEEARRWMLEYDERARHYEVVL
ncbi:MAG: antibiotic biosynthesis monooxygenase [Proteobacteria bacterium]|nr:antibiotic biosynthesis monooxygenase [Pseudomonadota bacterium]